MSSKHRYGMSDLKGVVETEKWGRDRARELVGEPRDFHGAAPPKDTSRVQSAGDAAAAGVPADKSFNDASGFVRGRGEDATKRPGYIHGYRK
jgi:hypothetical protein